MAVATRSPGLAVIGDQDWSLGMWRSVDRRLIPAGGAYDIENGLVFEDGSVAERGGSLELTGSGWSAQGVRWMWDGLLEAGHRTVVASNNAFGVLSDGDASIATLPLPPGVSLTGPLMPVAAELGDVLWIAAGMPGDGALRPLLYGGSRKSAAYSTGKLTATNDEDEVTGSGGAAFSANVDEGMLLKIGNADRWYVVDEVLSNTKLKLTSDFQEDDKTAVSYTARPLAVADTDTYVSKNNKGRNAVVGVVGKRLLISDGRRVFYSKWDNSHGEWKKGNVHKLPDGVAVVGIMGARNEGLIFSTDGVWALGNLEAPQVDDQGNPLHTFRQVAGDIVLWGTQGLVRWQQSVVCPALDGVWILDGRTQPELISRSITTLWQSYVRQGLRPGPSATYRGHLFMPIIDADQEVADVLVCRMDRPQRRGGQTIWPWTRLAAGWGMSCFARRVPKTAVLPKLLVGERAAASRVVEGTDFLAPSAAVKLDHDGAEHNLVIETRDYPSGANEGMNTVRKATVRYELDDAGDDPRVALMVDDGSGTWIELDEEWGESDGRGRGWWQVKRPDTGAIACRFVRYRVEGRGPNGGLRVRTVQSHVRQGSRLR